MILPVLALFLCQAPPSSRESEERMRILELYAEQQRAYESEKPYREAQAAKAAKEAMIADLVAMDVAVHRLAEWNVKNPDIIDAKMQAEANRLAKQADKSIRKYLEAQKVKQ